MKKKPLACESGRIAKNEKKKDFGILVVRTWVVWVCVSPLIAKRAKKWSTKMTTFHWACARSIRHHNYSGNSVAGSRILALPVLPVQVVFNNWVCGLLNHLVQVLTSAPLMTTTTTRHLVVVVAQSVREARFNRICYIVTEAKLFAVHHLFYHFSLPNRLMIYF